MQRHLAPSLWIAAALCAGCAAGKKGLPTVVSLRIDGTRALSQTEIEEKILTAQTSILPFTKIQTFDANAWHADLKRIERLYQARGYYQAKVVQEEVKPRGADAVALRVLVAEGEPTRIFKLHVEGLEDLPPEARKTALAAISLHPKDIFDEGAWEKSLKQLPLPLREKGYAEATATGDAQVDLANRLAELTVTVVHGPRFRFGQVTVAPGPVQVPAQVIAEEALAAVHPGDWYSDSALAEAQARVFKMNVFGAVKVSRGAPDLDASTIPVVVEVREAPFHTLRAGGGFAFDQTRNDIRLLGDFTHRNFGGGLRKLSLKAQAGWAFLPDVYSSLFGGQDVKNGPVFRLTGEFEQPHTLFRDVRLQTSLETERGLEPAYTYTGGRAKLGFVWQPHSSFTVFPSYNLEVYLLEQGVAQLGGNSPTLLFGCSHVCTLSYLEQRLEWDRRDDHQEPHHGSYLALTVQEGGGPLGGSFQYFRIQPEARGYKSFGSEEQFTLSARLRVGTLIPGNGTPSPIVARFFSGGPDMRGFNNRRLSPLAVIARRGYVPTDGIATQVGSDLPPAGVYNGATVPVGGNGLFNAQFEARYAFSGPLAVATFLDTGFVTPGSVEWTRPGYFSENLFYAVGFGVRYRTPVGPLRLDLAYRPNIGPPLSVENTGKVLSYPVSGSCFGIGRGRSSYAGAPEDPCTFHLSIGEAF